jgi:hypothetical protein
LGVGRLTRSERSERSRAMICDTFATESFGKPVVRAVRSVFPGAPARCDRGGHPPLHVAASKSLRLG